MGVVTVRIENAYSDGHKSERTVDLPAPAEGLEVEDWFEDIVWPETGDGHGSGTDLGSCYTATIIAAADPGLTGRTFEWTD